MTSRLEELAERVEKLTGPCREADEDIARAVGYVPARGSNVEIAYGHFYVDADGDYIGAPPKFTASLDAAMTLVPEGWFLADLGLWRSGAPTRTWAATLKLDPQCDERVHTSNKPSAAIALCTVALRARAASEDRHGG
jgi:hypothetical protein